VSRYLVTGCAGFIGSSLVDALLADGHEVVGIDRFTDYYPRDRKELHVAAAREHDAFTLLEIDLAQEQLSPIVAEVDGVFHLAAQAGVRGSWGDTFEVYVRDNVLATQRVFEAAASVGVRVAFASSSSVYGNAETYPTPETVTPTPVSPYGVTKLSCEHLARAYARTLELDAVSLRYFSVFGPRQRPDMAFSKIFMALLESKKFPVYGSGEQSRDFTYVEDAVRATIAAFERGRSGSVYNVGGGSETTLNEVIAIAETLAGTRLDVRRCPVAAGDPARTSANTTRVHNDTGWEARTSLEEGLASEFEFMRTIVGLAVGRYHAPIIR
jgi:UDP-glucose 4-epimerase